MNHSRPILRRAPFCVAFVLLLSCLVVLSVLAEPAGYPAVREGLNFGGQDVYFYNWWSDDYWDEYDESSATEAEKAQHAYRLWLQDTYNVSIHEVRRGEWGTCCDELMSFAFRGGEAGKLALFTLDSGMVGRAISSGAAAPITYDMSGDKWHQADIGLVTVSGNTYGTYVGSSEPRQCVFFNKRLLTEAGIDWNDLYDAQKNGAWTWDTFESYLTVIQDSPACAAAPLTGSHDDLMRIVVFAGGGSFIDTDSEGNLVPTVNSEASKAALSWAQRIWSEYGLPQPEGTDWDWYKSAWENGQAVFYVGQTYECYGNYGLHLQNGDTWGCVAFPKKQQSGTYVTLAQDNIVMAPSCYDEATVNNLIYLYDLWTDNPGYPEEDTWAESLYSIADDRRAVDETYAMLRSMDHQQISKDILTGGITGLLWSIGDDSDIDELTEQYAGEWQVACDGFTADLNNTSFRVFYPDSIEPGEDVTVIIRPEEGMDSYNLQVASGQFWLYEDPDVTPGLYSIPAVIFSKGGWFSIQCGASKGDYSDAGWSEKDYYGIEPAGNLSPLEAILLSDTVEENVPVSFSLSVSNPSRILVQQQCAYEDMGWPGYGGSEWVFVADLDGGAASFSGFRLSSSIPFRFRFSALVDGRWTAWSNVAVLRSGVCGADLVWSFADGTLTISGDGPMEDYGFRDSGRFIDPPWKELPISQVVFNGAVTRIGSWAFSGQHNLTAVDIPATVASVGESAFNYCGLAGTLIIPAGVTVIDDFAFCYNENLTAVVLPAGLETIGFEAFSSCVRLSAVSVPAGTETREHVFFVDYYDPVSDTTVESVFCLSLPDSVTAVHQSAFGCCAFTSAVPDFVLPSSLRVLSSAALSGTAPEYVWIPDETVSVSADAFAACPDLKMIRFPSECEITGSPDFPDGVLFLCYYDSPVHGYAEEYGIDYLTPCSIVSVKPGTYRLP